MIFLTRTIQRSLMIGLLMLLGACSSANETEPTPTAPAPQESVTVEMTTSMGAMRIELDAAAAPQTVANFLSYVDQGFYDDLIFHRVIANFMIQGGGFDTDFQRPRTQPAIRNESDNGLNNRRGTIAMARTQDPHSATSQFFINLVDNPSLDARGRQAGYTVFGELRTGFEVLDAIGAVATHTQATRLGTLADVPMEPVIIHHIRRLE